MRTIRKFLFLAIAVVCGCSTVQAPPISISENTLILRGVITTQTASDFHQALTGHRIHTVQLDSGGGDVASAIQIAREIHERGIDVEVVGGCFSSCANYIFPAGKTKTISGLGIVAWHGNIHHLLYLHEKGRSLIPKESLDSLKKIALLEKDFFTSISVDQFICWVGKIEPFNAKNFYFMGPSDMERFGLHDVRVRSDYEKTDLSPIKKQGIDIQYLSMKSEAYKPESPDLASLD